MAHYARPRRQGPRRNHVEQQTDGNDQRARFESRWQHPLRQRIEHEEIWAYRLDGGKLLEHRMVKQFPVSDASEVDGLRTDVDGRIFLARPSAGRIAIIAPDGTLVREVRTLGTEPTNLTFGGADGKTVFVTQKQGKFIEAFRTDRPGREPCLQVPGMC
jgi:sugar lactone lactonase YvrE